MSKRWTSISVREDIRDRAEEYMNKRESWNDFFERILNEIDYSRDIRKRFRLK